MNNQHFYGTMLFSNIKGIKVLINALMSTFIVMLILSCTTPTHQLSADWKKGTDEWSIQKQSPSNIRTREYSSVENNSWSREQSANGEPKDKSISSGEWGWREYNNTTVSQQNYSAGYSERLALVIGNGNYKFGSLKNPNNDATDISAALKNLGFDVVTKHNVNRQGMLDAINEFGRSLKDRTVALFYYSGYAIQVSGVNYLIPINSQIDNENDIEHEAIDIGRILGKMNSANNRVNIVMLDACRDNPARKLTRSASRGLAIIPKAPSGTIISYSSSPGDVSVDGFSRNSLYAAALLKYLSVPGLTIENVFKKTRLKLEKETNGKQVPWDISSLKGDFFFKPLPQYGQ